MILQQQINIFSTSLKRKVVCDLFLPRDFMSQDLLEVLILNDGQEVENLKLKKTLERLKPSLKPLLCIAIHAGDRLNEYGSSSILDFRGRGKKAKAYQNFICDELLPHIQKQIKTPLAEKYSAAGFSLGGLSALDLAWNDTTGRFNKVAAFSGSFWWRSKDLKDKTYTDNDRIIHKLVRDGSFKAGLKFWFEAGTQDEKFDRNNNGIIDSIDDTLDLIDELKKKGYRDMDIDYYEVEGGKHDYDTWSRAFPVFLTWAFAS